MNPSSLDRIFSPGSIAVIGASDKEGTIGCALISNIMDSGYPGQLFPVNPSRHTVRRLKAYPSVKAIGYPVDLVVIVTPIAAVPSIIRECVEAGVGGAIIISAGGKEVGAKGREIEEAIKKEAQAGGIRIIGPNCAGVICTGSKLNATFADHMALPGKMAFISQSGALCYGILDLSLKEQIGFSHFISIGSMLDVDFGDLIDHLGNDPEVNSIVLYIEGLTGVRKFMSAARSVSRSKPIVVLKAGRSAAGARAASSHTGALAGADAVYDAAFKRAGIVRVNTIEELFDCAELVSKQPVPKGPGLAIVTNAGGPGVMATDALSAYGIDPVSLSPETLSKLDSILPPFWSRNNPIDILGDAVPERFQRTVEACVGAPEIDGLMVICVPQAASDPTEVATRLVETLQGRSCPVFTVWIGGWGMEKAREIFNKAGIPTYETPERAIKAFVDMYRYKDNAAILEEASLDFANPLDVDHTGAASIIEETLKEGGTLLTEVESKRVLAAYGIPVTQTEVATFPEEAVRLAEKIGYPVVMKIHSRDITHKTDAHGVQLDLKNADGVEEAFGQIMASARAYNPKAKLSGVTVQRMLKRADYELILGSKRDHDFGPVILFGMGGVMTELLKDRSLGLPPLNHLLARRLIEETKVYQLLKGYRNRPPANLDLLEEILIRLSQLVADFPEIVELDINPLILVEEKAYAVDARIVVQPSDVPSPRHLVIGPSANGLRRE